MKKSIIAKEDIANGQPDVFENAIAIEKLEERLETASAETCVGIMAF